MNKKINTNICLYHEISRNQRKTEIKRGMGTSGTMGFENKGCYDCNGFNENCPSYTSLNTINQIK